MKSQQHSAVNHQDCLLWCWKTLVCFSVKRSMVGGSWIGFLNSFFFRKSGSYGFPAYEFCFSRMWFGAAKRLALKKPGSDPFEGQKLRDCLDMPGCVHRVRFMKFLIGAKLSRSFQSFFVSTSGQEVNLFWRIDSCLYYCIYHSHISPLYPTLFLALIASPYAGVVRSGLADDTDFLDEVGCQCISTKELNINGELSPIQTEVIIILDSVKSKCSAGFNVLCNVGLLESQWQNALGALT